MHDHVPATQYHLDPALSASGMKILATQTPAHFQHWRTAGETHADHFDIGTATHSLILEADTTNIRILDFPDWRTKDARTARDEAYAEGAVPILSKDWVVIRAMRDSIAQHPLARIALEGTAERSMFWTDPNGVARRARMDKHNPQSPIGPIIVDLKTTTNADPRKFGKAAADYGYHQQDANYRDGALALTGERHSFLFVQVEKTAPYLVSVVELAPEFVDLGRRLNDKAARLYAECTERGEWPGYPAADPIEAHVWAARDMEDLLS